MLSAVLVTVVLQAAPAGAQPPVVEPAHSAAIIERPAWVAKPTGVAVARVFPDRAMELAIPGRAVVQCRVRLTGLVDDCSIIEETPRGLGFGSAVLSLTSRFRLTPERHDGVEVDGAVVKIPITFTTPTMAPWTGEFTPIQAVACAAWHRARLEILPADAESILGIQRFSALARGMAASAGVGDDDIQALLEGKSPGGPPALPNASSICRLAV